jgi:hypothetical protein
MNFFRKFKEMKHCSRPCQFHYQHLKVFIRVIYSLEQKLENLLQFQFQSYICSTLGGYSQKYKTRIEKNC